jgi:hypothetical protein
MPIQRCLVVADHLGNNEVQELFGKLGIQPGVFGERPQPRDLLGLPYRVGRWQAMRRLQLTDLLSDLEPLSEEMHKRGVHVVDAHTKSEQLIGHRVAHGAQPSQLDVPVYLCRVGLDRVTGGLMIIAVPEARREWRGLSPPGWHLISRLDGLSADDYLNPLELFDFGVARRRHRLA